MKCPQCSGRLLSKIVRECKREVYRRRYCRDCGAGVTTLERVVILDRGYRAMLDVQSRAATTKGDWWNPAPPMLIKPEKRTVRGMGA